MGTDGIRTAIDVVEEAIGGKLTESLARRRLAKDIAKRIATAYYDFERDPGFVLPSGEGQEVVPYVHPGWSFGQELSSITRSVTSANERLEGVERSIKKLLLYYHRIAIPDGFSYECDFGGVYPGREEQFRFYLLLFARLRPLIQAGVVMFVPEIPTFFPAREAVYRMDMPDLSKQFESKLGPGPHGIVQEIVEQSLWVGANFDLNLFLPTPSAVGFFRTYSDILSRPQQSRLGALDAVAGSMTMTCELPALDKISILDLVRVRQDEVSFSIWRASLRRVLQATYEDFIADNLSEEDLSRLASEEFAQAKREIDKDIAKSSALGLVKTGVRSVGIGLVTGLVTAAAIANPLATVTALAASATSTFLWDYMSGLRSRRANAALRAHYAVWDTT